MDNKINIKKEDFANFSRLKRLEKEWDQAQKGNATRVNRLEQRVEQLEAEIATKVKCQNINLKSPREIK